MATRPSRLSRQQWLNIVILVISALVLMFVVIGRVMDSATPTQTQAENLKVRLQRIDFGGITLSQQEGVWSSSGTQLSTQRAGEIALNWQRLVTQSGDDLGDKQPQGKTVLLYFSHIPQPVVCKVAISAERLTIAFITSGQQFHLSNNVYWDYLPE